MKKLKGLDALADLHQAMGGERAALPTEQEGAVPAVGPVLLYVSRDKKARKGKEVTLVEGFDADQHAEVAVETARSLKAHCGVVVARHECAKLGKGARYLLEARVQEMRGGAPNHMFDGGAA